MPGDRKFIVGRDLQCDVPIADDSVSRQHAEIWFPESGKIMIADRGSSNGTVLIRDGTQKRITQEQVFSTDHVQFGSAVLSVRDILDTIRLKHFNQPAPAPAPPAPQPGPQKPAAAREPAQAARRLRCVCGAIKNAGEYCTSCGYKEP